MSLHFLEVVMDLAPSFLAANAKKLILLLHEPQYLHDRNTLDAEDRKSFLVFLVFNEALVIIINLH